MTGVVDAERARQKAWEDLGLPDPVRVQTEERITAWYTGSPFRSPKRDQLNDYFEAHPEKKPRWWPE
jgi:hypothetical protein